MLTKSRLMLAATAAMLFLSLPAIAQDTPEQSDVITQLQIKNDLSDEERAQLRTWLEARVQVIASGELAGAAAAATELRDTYAKGVAGFKDAFATAAIELIAGAYQRAPRDAAARLIALLNTLDRKEVYKTLVAALSDERVPVRTAAAVGLRRLRPLVARAGDNSFAETLAALSAAGKRETSAVALSVIYGALDYSGVGITSPNPKSNAAALLDLIDARGEQYAAKKVVAEAGDGDGLNMAERLLAQYTDDEKQKLIAATAAMLNYGVSRYTNDLVNVLDKGSSPIRIAERNRFEQFIATAEELLVKLTSPATPPGVAKTMQESVQDDKRLNVSNAMGEWVKILNSKYQIKLSTDPVEETTEP